MTPEALTLPLPAFIACLRRCEPRQTGRVAAGLVANVPANNGSSNATQQVVIGGFGNRGGNPLGGNAGSDASCDGCVKNLTEEIPPYKTPVSP